MDQFVYECALRDHEGIVRATATFWCDQKIGQVGDRIDDVIKKNSAARVVANDAPNDKLFGLGDNLKDMVITSISPRI